MSIFKNCAIWLSEKSIADLPPADIVYIRPAGGEDRQLLPDSTHPGEIHVDDGGFLAAAAFMPVSYTHLTLPTTVTV